MARRLVNYFPYRMFHKQVSYDMKRGITRNRMCNKNFHYSIMVQYLLSHKYLGRKLVSEPGLGHAFPASSEASNQLHCPCRNSPYGQ